MIVWTVANQKGGVGKTTTVVALAGLLAQRGKRVLLIDTDPHASLTSYFGYDSDTLDKTLYELFQEPKLSQEFVQQHIMATEFENISLMPASITLATLDRVLGNREGMGLILARALHKLSDDYDFAIIDCPPVLGVMMVNAIAACDRILVPVQTEFLAMKGLERMMRTFDVMKRSKKEGFHYTIIPTMFDRRTRASLQTLRTLKELYGDRVWNSVIPIDTKFRDASLQHIPPSIYAKGSRGSYAYWTLLNTVLQLDEKAPQS